MKIKKSHLKELIRQSIRSIVSEADDGKYVHIGYGRYKKKGQEDKEGAPTFKKTDVGKFVKTTPEDDDVGGPAHVNVPKKEPAKPKTTKISADPFADDKPTYIHKGGDKLKSLKVRHPEKPKSKAPKPGEEFTIDQVMNATIKGDKVGDILDNPKHPNYDKAEKYASQFNPDDEKLVTGKGPQVKDGPKPGGDWDNDQIMNATIGGDKVSDVLGNDNHPANAQALKYVMQFDPDDEKVISGPGGDDFDAGGPAHANVPKGAKSSKEAKKKIKKTKAIDSLNKQAEAGKNQGIDTERYGSVSWESGDPNEDTFFAIDQEGESIEIPYDEIVRFWNPDEVDVKGLTGE